MNHPQQKAWAMKHPALAKAFAVALVVMCFILLFAAVKGFTERADEYEDRLRYEKRFSERIDNYIRLSEELEDSISYDEAWAELEKIIEQHEDDASQHKTDLAMNTAERGGNTMGAELLLDAMNQLKGAKQQFEDAKKNFEQLQAALTQMRSTYDNEGKMLKSAAEQAAAGCDLSMNNEGLRKVIEITTSEPEIPTTVPTAPVMPVEPLTPEALESKAPQHPGEGATEQELADYETALAAHNAYVAAYTEQYPAILKQYQQDKEKAEKEYDNRLKEFNLIYQSSKEAHEKWEQDLAVAVAAVDFDSLAMAAAMLQGTYDQISGPSFMMIQQMGAGIKEIIGAMTEMGEAFGGAEGLGGMGMGQMPMVVMENLDPATASYAQIRDNAYNAASDYVKKFGELKAKFGAIVSGFGGLEMGLTGLEAAVAQAEGMLVYAEDQMKAGEAMVHREIANVWYNLGELEKEKADLAEQKAILDEEAAVLSKEIKEAEELRELENDHVSAKLLLTSVKEVSDMFEESGELVPSAEKYLESYKAETESLYSGRLIVCILSVIGGIAGLAGIPAVYEFVRKRFWLIWPVVLCMICAAAAEAVYYFSVHEMWYVGLFVAIIAALHLLIVIPKEKRPS